jgi:hypothetical protein
MLYVYDTNSVRYKDATYKVLAWGVGLVLLVSTVAVMVITLEVNDVRFITQETKEIIINEKNEFSPEKLKAYILELNLRHPHIIYAQARLESGNFNSPVFRTNHNLFGMKVATKRPTTNQGEENGHAYYNNWRESVVDYAFYQAQYLSDIKTEADYLQYLKDATYSTNPNYITELSRIINEEKRK